MSDAKYPTPFPSGYTPPPYGRERIANITDGTSNTLMVGEYYTIPKGANQGRTTLWAYTYTSFNQSEVVLPPQTRQLYADYDKCVNSCPSCVGTSNPCKRSWGSFHPNVINFVMVDGSVRPNRAVAAMATAASKGGMTSRWKRSTFAHSPSTYSHWTQQ